MSVDIAGHTASNIMNMGLDAESTKAVLEMLDAFEVVLRESIYQEILNSLYNEANSFPGPHWKFYAEGYEYGKNQAAEIAKGHKYE
jgi:hypothetical protein